MFRRKEKKTFIQRCAGNLWPGMGWRRMIKYWGLRVNRLPGSAYSISCGFACGAAVSFTPFVGLHFIFGGILAWIFRGNIIASAIGTAVGNPWTFPFIWLWIYNCGLWMGFGRRSSDQVNFDFAALFGQTSEAALKFDHEFVINNAWPILRPMLAGSVPTSIVMWLLFYYLIKHIINYYRHSSPDKTISDTIVNNDHINRNGVMDDNEN